MEKTDKGVSATALGGSRIYRPERDSHRQRASIRKVVPCIVQLHFGSSLILPRKTEDLNLTGIFVEMDTPGIVVGDSMEVWLGAENEYQKPVEMILPAEVVRVEERGLALKFRPYPSKAYTQLVSLLYAW